MMRPSDRSDEIVQQRRRFFGAAAMPIAAGESELISAARAQIPSLTV